MPATAMISGPASGHRPGRAPGDVELDTSARSIVPAVSTSHLLASADPPGRAAEREPRRSPMVEVRDERLQRMILVVRRAPGCARGSLEERPQIGSSPSGSGSSDACPPARAVDDRELDLALVRVEVEEELVDLVDHLLDARVGPVDLVDDQDHGQPRLEAFRRTNRVCGSGPSVASTSRSTPSTIVSPRSTSPPKSAWPGVSTMLIFVPP